MPEDGSPRHSPLRRTLIASARAAALFILIAGINGVLAIAVPRFAESSRHVVSLIAGVIIFELLRPGRRPRAVPVVAERQELDPRDAEELAALRDETARLRVQVQTLEETGEQRAAATAEVDAARQREAELRGRYEKESEHLQRAAGRAMEEVQHARSVADELRGEIERERERAAAAVQELERERKQAKDGAQSAAAAAEQNAALRSAAVSLKQELERERQRADQAMRELQNALTSAAAVATQRQKFESQIAESGKRLASAMQELDGLRTERQRIRREIEETRQRSEVEKNDIRRSIEAAWTDKLQKAIEKLSDDHEEAVAAAVRQREARVEQLQKELAGLREAIDAEWSAKLQQSIDKLTADHQRKLGEEIAQRETALRGAIDAEWSAKLQSIVEKLAADHENDVGEAIAQRESARAEVRALNARFERLQQELAARPAVDETSLRKTVDAEWSAKLQSIVNKLAADHENDVGEAMAQRESARAEVRALTGGLEQLRQELAHERQRSEQLAARPAAEEKALRDSIEAEWSAKLQKIVSELAMDHENDIGEAIASREAARAESRSLTARVQELQRQLEVAQNDFLAAKIPDLPASDEKAIRESIEAEWSAKLQTIVSHLATDHEADVGKAIEEREAARAEARNLAMKVTSLQQKGESERQTWQAKLGDLEREIAALRSASPPPAAEVQPAGEDERRAREEVLQFAEQANAAMRSATAAGNVPIPPDVRRARVLFVHHDPSMRSLWRENLARSGFDVQTASDGLEGLRLTTAGKPDVVIADASMPKMDGRELCQLIKSNQETSGVKVILMTGVYTNETPIESASREFEADELLRKPIKLEALQAALSSLLAPTAGR